MIPLFLIKMVGERAAKPVFFGLIGVVIVACAIMLAKCSGRDRTAERQAEQTTRSGDAYANASNAAIGTIERRHDTDAAGDSGVAETQRTIDNAQDPDAVRNAVIDRVCRSASHRHDPACPVR